MPDNSVVEKKIPLTFYFGNSVGTDKRKAGVELAFGFNKILTSVSTSIPSEKIASILNPSDQRNGVSKIEQAAHDFIERNQEFIGVISSSLNEILNHEDRLNAARANQALAVDFLSLILHPDPLAAANANELTTVVRLLAKEGNFFGKRAQQILNGARAQAGLAHVFHTQGYEVLFPVVVKKVVEEKGDKKVEKIVRDEIEMWDLHGGVDFVAISPNEKLVLFVDAKARIEMKDPQIKPISWLNDKHEGIKNDIKQYRQKCGKPLRNDCGFVIKEICVPSDDLGRFGKISDSMKDMIIKNLFV
jgi:hypothetical protein